VSSGLVASVGRPGGNVTGSGGFSPELITKRLELLKQVLPGVRRVGALWLQEYPQRFRAESVKAAELASRRLGVQVEVFETQGPADFERTFSEMTRARVSAVLIIMPASYRTPLADLAAKNRLPAVYEARQFADAGGLMSYGADIADQFRHAATYVDKILKGAKPADLPVEQPTKFEL